MTEYCAGCEKQRYCTRHVRESQAIRGRQNKAQACMSVVYNSYKLLKTSQLYFNESFHQVCIHEVERRRKHTSEVSTFLCLFTTSRLSHPSPFPPRVQCIHDQKIVPNHRQRGRCQVPQGMRVHHPLPRRKIEKFQTRRGGRQNHRFSGV